MKNLKEKQMIAIIKSKKISEQTKAYRKQVMEFAFGEEFIASKTTEENPIIKGFNSLRGRK